MDEREREIVDLVDLLSRFNPGRKANRFPHRIHMMLGGEGLAAFVRMNVVAAFICRRFPGAKTCAFYRDEPPERGAVVSCNPRIRMEMRAPPGSPVTAPLDWYDVGSRAPVQCADPNWAEQEMTLPNLFLGTGLLSADPARLAGLGDNPPLLRLPEAPAPQAVAVLTPGPTEADWKGLAAHLEHALGLRAVGLDPAAPFAARLTRIATARMVIGGDADAVALAGAFGTPCAGLGDAVPWARGDVTATSGALIAAAEHLAAQNRPRTERPVEPTPWLDLPLPRCESLVEAFS